MYHEINVSLNGQHLFATNERSILSLNAANKLIEIFKVKFPKSEGYEISLTCWTKSGKTINVS